MSAANESAAWVDAGEHRYQVKRIPRKSPTGQDFIKVLKWGEGGAAKEGKEGAAEEQERLTQDDKSEQR